MDPPSSSPSWLAPPATDAALPANFNTQPQGGLTRSSRQSSLAHLVNYTSPDRSPLLSDAGSSSGHHSPAPSVSPASSLHSKNSGFVVTSRRKSYQPPPSPDARLQHAQLGPSPSPPQPPPPSQLSAAGGTHVAGTSPAQATSLAATPTNIPAQNTSARTSGAGSLSHTPSLDSRRGSSSPTGSSQRKPSHASSRSSARTDPHSPYQGEPKTTLTLSSSIDSRGRRMVNQYVRLKTIGQGSHGKVWLCAEPTLPDSDEGDDDNNGDANEDDADAAARRKGKRAQRRLQRWEEEIEAGNFRYCAIKSVARDGPQRGKSLRAAKSRRAAGNSSAGDGSTTGISADDKIKREVAIMKRLDHPNIVRLKEVIDDVKSKKVFMVLEFMAGGQVVWQDDNKRPTLTVDEARRTFRDVLLGLEYLHYHGIIHRDIKPANLLWTEDHSVVKISDFGVSHVSEALLRASPLDHDGCTHTDDDKALRKTAGSPAFFAPELCHPVDATPTPTHGQPDSASTYFGQAATPEGAGVSAGSSHFLPPATMSNGIPLSSTLISQPLPPPDASKPRPRPQIGKGIDIWALGVTLYCLLFGDTPFTAHTEYELYNVIAREPIRVPERMGREGTWTGVPTPHDWVGRGDGVEGREVVDLLGRLLDKDPSKRITLAEVKKHPWVLRNLSSPASWLCDTDPVKSQSVNITEEDVKQATQARGPNDSLPPIRNQPGIRRALNAALIRFPAFARIKSQRSSAAEDESSRSRSKSASSTSQHDHEPTNVTLSRTSTDEIQIAPSYRKRPSIDLGDSLRRIISSDQHSASRSSSPAGTIGRGGWGNFSRKKENGLESHSPSNAVSPVATMPSSPAPYAHPPLMPGLARSVSSSSVSNRALGSHLLLGRKNSERSDSSARGNSTPSSDGGDVNNKRGLSRILSKLGGSAGERRGAGRMRDDTQASATSDRPASDEDAESTTGSTVGVVPQALVDHFESSAAKFDSFGRAVRPPAPERRVSLATDDKFADDDEGMIDITEFEYSESDEEDIDDDDDDDDEYDDFLMSPIAETNGDLGWNAAFGNLGIGVQGEHGLLSDVSAGQDEVASKRPPSLTTPKLEDSTPRPSKQCSLGAGLDPEPPLVPPPLVRQHSQNAQYPSQLHVDGKISPLSPGSWGASSATPTVSPRDGSIRAVSMEPPTSGARRLNSFNSTQDDEDDDDVGIFVAPRRRRATTVSGTPVASGV